MKKIVALLLIALTQCQDEKEIQNISCGEIVCELPNICCQTDMQADPYCSEHCNGDYETRCDGKEDCLDNGEVCCHIQTSLVDPDNPDKIITECASEDVCDFFQHGWIVCNSEDDCPEGMICIFSDRSLNICNREE